PRFNLHLTCSSLDSDRLTEIDSSLNVKEIPNGVDIDYFVPQPENEKPKHLIFAGALNWYPNRDAMLYFSREIWPLLKKSDPNITMNVVGSSPPSELFELAAKDPNFKVHGFVDDVREYISSASIYVCPITDGGGTKLKILDSFAMGMATVAHPVACEGISAYDGDNVLFASSVEEFVEKITLLTQDHALRKRLGANARKTAVREYAYTSIGEKLAEQYTQIIANDQDATAATLI
ncbi:MAG: glycosyltransferase family 4 protein, partial [Gammaproteobacteria bacterium]|nr:glycosyltransferase family 4 protein [Gammaproteobacteria bacterium]